MKEKKVKGKERRREEERSYMEEGEVGRERERKGEGKEDVSQLILITFRSAVRE